MDSNNSNFQVVAPRYGDYTEPQDMGIRRRYKVHGQVSYFSSMPNDFFNSIKHLTVLTFQDMEVTYFHAYIDGVDFVFIESPVFRHTGNNIYGGNRLVCLFILKFCL